MVTGRLCPGCLNVSAGHVGLLGRHSSQRVCVSVDKWVPTLQQKAGTGDLSRCRSRCTGWIA